jgi:hypothetical protein
MTNEEIQAIKKGDEVHLYHTQYGIELKTSFRVKSVRIQGRGAANQTKGHRFAIVETEPFEDRKYQTAVLESDEYIRALDFDTHNALGNRVRGVEKHMFSAAYGLMAGSGSQNMFGGKP